jgi:SAM-dependent methyltransferase
LRYAVDVALHDLNPVGRFDDRAADYVRYRPSYPAAAIDTILAGLGPPSALTAADVGAGTGISARLVGDRGVRVIAVEPGRAMSGAAAPHPRVCWVRATAEATGLATGALALVLCAQSFHWFRADEAVREFARVLAPGGRLAIMWNRRSVSDPLTAGYGEAIAAVGDDAEANRAPFAPGCVERSGAFSPVTRTSVPSHQRLDLDGLLGRARSASYVPKTGPASDRLVQLLTDLHARHSDASGAVTLVYETEIFSATRAA